MPLESLGNIGSFISGIAVVVSLVYLALQIRQNTKMLRASALASTTATYVSFNHVLGSDRQTARVFQLGLEDFETLNKDERRQFLNLLRATLISYEHVFKTYEAGLLDEEVWIRYRDAAKHILQLPHLRVWWDARKNAYVPSFVRAIDAAPNVARSKLASEVIREMLEHAHKQD